MNRLKHIIIVLFALVAFFTACKKNCPIVVPVAVDAGIYDSVQLPADTLTITGTVKSGATAGMKYLWTVVSGPGIPVFESDTSASTLIKDLVAGTYVLQFQATNNSGLTGLDTTSIIVKSEPTPFVLTLQPVDNAGETVMTQLNGTDERVGYSPESFVLSAWTKGGLPYSTRMAIKFDLSGIPAGATILSADLYLYSNPTPDNGNQVDANFGVDNSMVVQQITVPWDSTTISFYNPPTITMANEVQVPSTNMSFLDLNLDVKNMIVSMVSQHANYGFFARLNNEVIYTDRCFVSSYNIHYPDKHPKLVIVYK